ncbi:MAG: phosphate ABC transporter substrate-binding protein PstS [Pseudonocardia sp.]|nr:phosphate ABC transporter substrate-binding protein PstS [Pseudonocardia sp.]
MKLKRHTAVLALAAASVLMLSACGSDVNTTTPGAPSGGAAAVSCGGKKSLTAEGSTAQQNAMDAFIAAYQQACPGYNLAYNGTGSGAGVKQFTAGLVDIGGTDSPLDPSKGETTAAANRCKNNPAWDLPMVFGPITVAFNLKGVNDLTLNPETIAKIFSGQIKTWNDPAIAALNSGVTLPATPIAVQYRSDQSGTTDNFQTYLKDASKGVWTKGTGKTFNGGVGEGKQGNPGVGQGVSATNGAIGYVEWSFSQQNKLTIAKIDSGSGPVALTNESVGKAIDGATIKGEGNDLVLDLNSIYSSSASGAYPLVLATYELACSKGYDPDTATAVKAFLTAAATTGQNQLSSIGYIPLPQAFQNKILTAIKAIS